MAHRETIADLVPTAATAFGNATFITVLGERTWTFREIERDVSLAAGGLASAGIKKGDRVALHLPNGWAWIVCYHAIARLNAVVVPINILLTATEASFICSDADVQALIATADRSQDIVAKIHGGVSTPLAYAVRPDDLTIDGLLNASSGSRSR